MKNMTAFNDCEYNIILIGNSGVGKTSLALEFTKGEFREKHFETVIADNFRKKVVLEGKEINLNIWDLSGKQSYRSFLIRYFEIADGALLVYDVTNVKSLNDISNWWRELRSCNPNCQIIIVGNKIDKKEGKTISPNEVANIFQKDANHEVRESSAKIGENVEEMFRRITLKILETRGISIANDNHSSTENSKMNEKYYKTPAIKNSLEQAVKGFKKKPLELSTEQTFPIFKVKTSETSLDDHLYNMPSSENNQKHSNCPFRECSAQYRPLTNCSKNGNTEKKLISSAVKIRILWLMIYGILGLIILDFLGNISIFN